MYVTQKMEWDPAVLWTKASGLFMPLLYDPNSLWIATIDGGASGASLDAYSVDTAEGGARQSARARK